MGAINKGAIWHPYARADWQNPEERPREENSEKVYSYSMCLQIPATNNKGKDIPAGCTASPQQLLVLILFLS